MFTLSNNIVIVHLSFSPGQDNKHSYYHYAKILCFCPVDMAKITVLHMFNNSNWQNTGSSVRAVSNMEWQ